MTALILLLLWAAPAPASQPASQPASLPLDDELLLLDPEFLEFLEMEAEAPWSVE